jgi:DNA-binding GntR family transcriptional regulator
VEPAHAALRNASADVPWIPLDLPPIFYRIQQHCEPLSVTQEGWVATLSPLTTDRSRSDRVYLRLKEAITTLALRPGAPLIETEIARSLGVSTTPVREALQRLGQDGLVVSNRYRGATVSAITERDVREIYELREAFEPLATRLAVPVLTEADLDEMRQTLRRASSLIAEGDWRELSHLNRQFHGVLIGRCPNGRLRRVLDTLQDQNRIIALLTWEGRGYDAHEHDEHVAILDAADRRDAALAAEHLRRHIARFGRDVVRIWEERSSRAEEEPPLAAPGMDGARETGNGGAR